MHDSVITAIEAVDGTWRAIGHGIKPDHYAIIGDPPPEVTALAIAKIPFVETGSCGCVTFPHTHVIPASIIPDIPAKVHLWRDDLAQRAAVARRYDSAPDCPRCDLPPSLRGEWAAPSVLWRSGMSACEYLANVGLLHLGGPDRNQITAREKLLELSEANDRRTLIAGVRVTWHDRVPGLVTWAGQQTLPKLVRRMLKDLESMKGESLMDMSAVSPGGGAGIDPMSTVNADVAGFSPAAQNISIRYYPARELLAMVGLESVPVVSYRWRECGFLHDGRLWRFEVRQRVGGYYFVWGDVRPESPEEVTGE